MKDEYKTKKQLTDELEEARKQIKKLDTKETKRKNSDIPQDKQVEKVIQQKEKYFRSLIENALDIVMILDEHGVVSFVSPSIERSLGFKPEELLNKTAFEFVHPDDVQKITATFLHGIKIPDYIVSIDFRTLHKDGSWHFIEGIGRNLLRDPVVKGVIINFRDITERKESEDKLRLLKEAIEPLPIGITISDVLGKIVYSNLAEAEMHGYMVEELIGKDARILAPPELWKPLSFDQLLKIGVWKRRRKNINKSGELFPVELTSIAVIDAKGIPIGIITACEDITKRIKKENDLKVSEERYRTLVEEQVETVCRWLPDTTLTYVNQSYCDFYGKSREDLIGKKWISFVPKASREAVTTFYESLAADPRVATYEHEVVKADGSRRWQQWTESPIKDDLGNVVEMQSVGRDITESKIAQDKIEESEERYRELFENTSDIIQIVAPDGHFLYVNRAWREALGYNEEEIPGLLFSDIIHPDNRNHCNTLLQRVLSGEKISNVETEIVAKDGRKIMVEGNVICRFFEGTPLYTQCFLRDVTERKRAAENLQRSEEYFRALIENSSDIVIILDKKGIITYTSSSIERFLGYKPEELLGKSGFNFILPADLPRAMYDFGKAIITKEVNIPNAFRVRHKDGSERILEGVGRNLFDNSVIAGFVINARDVTDRKQAEVALRTSEAQLSNALRIAHLGHWEYDVASDLFTFNDHFYAIFRTTDEEVGGYTMSSAHYTQRFVHPDDISAVSTEIQKAIETDDPLYSRQLEHRIIYADGETGYITVRFFIVKDDQGKTVKTYGANQDITEQKQIEEELKTRVKELEDFYDMAVGRELKMKELKEEIEKLQKKLTQYQKDQGGNS